MKRQVFLFMITGLAILLIAGGCKKEPEKAQQPQPPCLTQNPHAGASNAVAGVHWTVPQRWSDAGPRQMRIATFSIPAGDGDPEGAECAVFFFGNGQGGDVQMNIDRWASQFEGTPKPKQSTKEVNGLNVTLVQIAGNYLAPGGPMMQSTGKKENYRLLGAIVAAPEGSVFFKVTGPAKSVSGAEDEFNELVGSIMKM